MRYEGRLVLGSWLAAVTLSAGCLGTDQPTDPATQHDLAVAVVSAAGLPPANEVPLDPTTIPMFQTQLPILPVWAPTVIKNSSGQVIRNEYTISDSEASVQMLPAGYPPTTVFAQNGPIVGGGNFTGSPGATFESIRGTPTVVHWRTNIQQPYFLPVDPTIAWANPQAIEEPLPPFNLFPPGYQNAQFPVARVTHTHGLVVLPQMDGTANEWFTNVQYRGPSFTTNDYTMPNDQPPTQLFYHDHVLGRDSPRRVRRRGRRGLHDSRSQRHGARRSQLAAAQGAVRGRPGHRLARLLHRRPTALSARPGRAERRRRRAAEHRLLVVQRGCRHRGGQRRRVAEPQRPASAISLPDVGGGEHAAVGSAARQSEQTGPSCR